MDSLRIQVLKPSGGTGTLDRADETTVKQVLREVADGGWVVLKGSTKVTAGCAKKDIVDNKVRLPWNKRDELTSSPVYPSDPFLSPRWKIYRSRLPALSFEGERFSVGTFLKLGGTGTGRWAGWIFLHPSWGN